MIEITLAKQASKPGRFHAMVDGECVVTSKTPIFSAARVLIADGYDPATSVQCRHEGNATPVLRDGITLGDLAPWTITEADRGSLKESAVATEPVRTTCRFLRFGSARKRAIGMRQVGMIISMDLRASEGGCGGPA